MPFEIVELPAHTYAYLRHLGPYHEIGGTFERMAAIAGPAGLVVPGSLFIGVYHDDPSTVAPADLRSDAGITLVGEPSLPDGLEQAELPGGKFAKWNHIGPYHKIGEAWHAFMSEMGSSGTQYRPGAPFELYISSMDTTPPDQLLTELYAPVA